MPPVSAGRPAATRDALAPVAAAALGGRRLRAVTRLRGGSKKGVYRAVLDDDSTVIIYVWGAAENYWPAAPGGADERADPFSDASGLDLFRAAQDRLTALRVRTPRLYLADASRERYPADVAVVEDVPGPSLEALIAADPAGAQPVLARLGAALRALHDGAGPTLGKIGFIEGDDPPRPPPGAAAQIVLRRAERDLAQAAARDPRIAGAAGRIGDALQRRAAAIAPRPGYRLIHGELGPDHVLVDGAGQPVIIDIEGLMYFDVEWEHVFLRLRFGADYRFLSAADLDPARLRLYELAMHLSLVAGPLRLLDGDFPDRAEMLAIAEYNLQRVLASC
jgi:Phosphotransferase enzyme family